jgi:hypothetical protein
MTRCKEPMSNLSNSNSSTLVRNLIMGPYRSSLLCAIAHLVLDHGRLTFEQNFLFRLAQMPLHLQHPPLFDRILLVCVGLHNLDSNFYCVGVSATSFTSSRRFEDMEPGGEYSVYTVLVSVNLLTASPSCATRYPIGTSEEHLRNMTTARDQTILHVYDHDAVKSLSWQFSISSTAVL